MSLFTEDVIEFLIKESGKSLMTVQNFQKLVESRMSNEGIIGVAKNWKNVNTAMKSNLAVSTVGLTYVVMFFWFMEYIAEKEAK